MDLKTLVDVKQTACPRCGRKIMLDRGYDGEGGVDFCCEHTFYWGKMWGVRITDDNRGSYERMLCNAADRKE